MRQIMLLVHRYCGLASMVFLALAALTGCLLVLRVPLDTALNQDLMITQTDRGMEAQDILTLVGDFQSKNTALQVIGFPTRVEAGHTVVLEVTGKPGASDDMHSFFYVHPQTGDIVGARDIHPSLNRRGFVFAVAEFHFTLLAGSVGRWLLGGIAVLWTLSSIAGLILTLPERGPFWRQWWRTWQFRRKSRLPRLLLDLHRSSALWLLPFIIILGFTSIALNFWDEAYAPTVTRFAPLQHTLFDQEPPFPAGRTPKLDFSAALSAAASHAQREQNPWLPARLLYLPQWNLYGAKLSPKGHLSYKKLGPIDYYFDGDTGQFVHPVDPYNDSLGLALIRVVYPVHSGEVFGLTSLIIVFLTGLATLLQSGTGLYVYIKKRASRVAARRLRDAKAAAG